MRQFRTWLRKQFEKLLLLPDYFRALAKEWLNILFGETLVGIGFLVWWALGAPTNHALIAVFLLAMFVAGYYAWRVDHSRFIPKYKVTGPLVVPTPTEDPGDTKMYLQIQPECLTDASVEDCRARLLLVSTMNMNGEWVPSAMDAPLNLGWDYYGHGSLTLDPGIGQRLCICWWDHFKTFVPTVDPLPSKWRNVFGSQVPFKFDVRMTAKDCPPVDFSVTISLVGQNWDQPMVELITKATS